MAKKVTISDLSSEALMGFLVVPLIRKKKGKRMRFFFTTGKLGPLCAKLDLPFGRCSPHCRYIVLSRTIILRRRMKLFGSEKEEKKVRLIDSFIVPCHHGTRSLARR